jgi:hypothetical protein
MREKASVLVLTDDSVLGALLRLWVEPVGSFRHPR